MDNIVRMNCPLCLSQDLTQYFDITENVFKIQTNRTYQSCNRCSLVFLNQSQRITANKEKSRYSVHENFLEQEGYTQFLQRIWLPLKKILAPGSCGLDYGSGPTRALANLIEADGFVMETYDPFFRPELKEQKYDFITCTEVLEHVFDLKLVLTKIMCLLKPGGYFAVMTELLTKDINFSKWRYRDDDTHVCFFTPETINYISEENLLKIEFCDNKRVVIFKKK